MSLDDYMRGKNPSGNPIDRKFINHGGILFPDSADDANAVNEHILFAAVDIINGQKQPIDSGYPDIGKKEIEIMILADAVKSVLDKRQPIDTELELENPGEFGEL